MNFLDDLVDRLVQVVTTVKLTTQNEEGEITELPLVIEGVYLGEENGVIALGREDGKVVYVFACNAVAMEEVELSFENMLMPSDDDQEKPDPEDMN